MEIGVFGWFCLLVEMSSLVLSAPWVSSIVKVERNAISALLEYKLDGATERHKTHAYSQDIIYRTRLKLIKIESKFLIQ